MTLQSLKRYKIFFSAICIVAIVITIVLVMSNNETGAVYIDGQRCPSGPCEGTLRLTNETAATCTSEGERVFTCSNSTCYAKTFKEIIPALEHNYGNWQQNGVQGHTRTCTRTGCGYIEREGHKAAEGQSCTEKGKCPTCNYELLPALGHSVESWSYANGDSSKHQGTCTTCNNLVVETHILGGYVSASDSEEATHHYTWCEKCQNVYGDLIPHDWVNATCEKPKTCSMCFYTSGDALGHDSHVDMNWREEQWDKGDLPASGIPFTDGSHKAICLRDGCGKTYFEPCTMEDFFWDCCINGVDGHIRCCAVCHLDFADTYQPCIYDYDNADLWDPFINENGEQRCVPVCTVCGYESNYIEFEHLWVDATCTTAKHCSRCGYEDKEHPKVSHTYVYDNTKQPNASGHVMKCTMCGDYSSEEHTMSRLSCTEAQRCSKCNYTNGQVLEHSYGEWEPDGENGHKRTCTRSECGNIERKSHKTATGQTCTTDGVCPDCGYVLAQKTGHSYGEWEPDGENGHKRICTRSGCGNIERKSHKTATGQTCTTDGVCPDCGYVLAQKTGHSYGEWEPDGENGHKRTCTRSGCGNIDRKSHKTATGASCTKDGVCPDCKYVLIPAPGHIWENNKCTRCNAIRVNNESDNSNNNDDNNDSNNNNNDGNNDSNNNNNDGNNDSNNNNNDGNNDSNNNNNDGNNDSNNNNNDGNNDSNNNNNDGNNDSNNNNNDDNNDSNNNNNDGNNDSNNNNNDGNNDSDNNNNDDNNDSNNNNNDDNNDSNNNNNNNNSSNTNDKKDNTIANNEIPKTGRFSVVRIISVLIVSSVIGFVKFRKYKNI